MSLKLRLLIPFLLISISTQAQEKAAELPLPMPQVPFSAKVRMMGGITGTMRHQDGKMRMDMASPEMPAMSIITIIDLKAKKGVTLMPMLGPKTAMEVDLTEDMSQGPMVGKGQKIGKDKIMGEECDLWQVKAPDTEGPVTSCLSMDGIPLRTRAMIKGKEETMMEILEIERAPQDASLFTLPSDTNIMKVPTGMMKGAMPKMQFKSQ